MIVNNLCIDSAVEHTVDMIFSLFNTTVKPSPPVNLSHIQTIEAELILHWDDPEDIDSGLLRYEVRYSSNTNHPAWQVNTNLCYTKQS